MRRLDFLDLNLPFLDRFNLFRLNLFRFKLLSMLMAVFLVVPRMAGASVIAPLTEPELVAKADTIVFGTVVNTQAVRGPDGSVYTRAQVQVYRGVRGAKVGDIVEVQVPGGDLDNGITVTVSGSPRLAIGEMVFGFCERRGSVVLPLGMSFGLLRVRQIAPGDLRVFRDLEGLQLMPRIAGPKGPSAFVIGGERLDDFAQRIESRVRALRLPAVGGGVVKP